MGTLLLLLFVGIGIYFIYRHYKGKTEIAYESENYVDTQSFTFKQAIEGCCVAVTQIRELDEEYKSIDEIMRKKQKANGSWNNLLNLLLKKDVYKENINYPESEKNRKYRIYFRYLLLLDVLVSLSPLILMIIISLFPWQLSLILVLISIGLLIIKAIKVIPPKAIRKEQKMYPWRFNPQPLGSQMYILQQEGNDVYEKTHRIYYDLYLPCKRKADELIVDSKNRESEYYKVYLEVSKYETYMYNCTPKQRIKKAQKESWMRDVKIAATIATVATVAVTAGFMSMLNNAGKDMFTGGPKYRDKWIDRETGEKYDYDPR